MLQEGEQEREKRGWIKNHCCRKRGWESWWGERKNQKFIRAICSCPNAPESLTLSDCQNTKPEKGLIGWVSTKLFSSPFSTPESNLNDCLNRWLFAFNFFSFLGGGKGGTVLKNSNLLSYFQMCIIWGLFNSSLSSFYAQSSSSKENQQWLQLFFFFFLKKRIRLFLKRKHIEGRLSFIMHFSVSTACDSKE